MDFNLRFVNIGSEINKFKFYFLRKPPKYKKRKLNNIVLNGERWVNPNHNKFLIMGEGSRFQINFVTNCKICLFLAAISSSRSDTHSVRLAVSFF